MGISVHEVFRCECCGKPCDKELRHVLIELPDWPYVERELAWVSTCCGDDYSTLIETEDDP